LELRKNDRYILALTIVVRLASLLSKSQDQAELLDYDPAGNNDNFSGNSSNIPVDEPGSGIGGHYHHNHHGASGSSTRSALHPMMNEAARRIYF